MSIEEIKKAFKSVDKWLHVLATYSVTLTAFVLLVQVNLTLATIVGPVAGASAGVLKEQYDKRHPEKHTYEVLDLVADGVGLVLALIPIIVCVCSR